MGDHPCFPVPMIPGNYVLWGTSWKSWKMLGSSIKSFNANEENTELQCRYFTEDHRIMGTREHKPLLHSLLHLYVVLLDSASAKCVSISVPTAHLQTEPWGGSKLVELSTARSKFWGQQTAAHGLALGSLDRRKALHAPTYSANFPLKRATFFCNTNTNYNNIVKPLTEQWSNHSGDLGKAELANTSWREVKEMSAGRNKADILGGLSKLATFGYTSTYKQHQEKK